MPLLVLVFLVLPPRMERCRCSLRWSGVGMGPCCCCCYLSWRSLCRVGRMVSRRLRSGIRGRRGRCYGDGGSCVQLGSILCDSAMEVFTEEQMNEASWDDVRCSGWWRWKMKR